LYSVLKKKPERAFFMHVCLGCLFKLKRHQLDSAFLSKFVPHHFVQNKIQLIAYTLFLS
jgi:hypothetical protein